jgi:hypothetical protein
MIEEPNYYISDAERVIVASWALTTPRVYSAWLHAAQLCRCNWMR